ncbi:MAG: DUF58 domain-containing protein [Candidatus Kariarchaeaceae archaeon]|jgi:uncharacterized protein (DUF58 family)
MQAKLNTRGIIFTSTDIVMIALSVFLRSPPLILISTIGMAYLIAYPLYVRNHSPPEVEIDAILRHGVLFRGEVDVIKIEITNKTGSPIPLLVLNIEVPMSLYFVDRPSRYILSMDPNSTQVLTIPILPTARGAYVIGPFTLSISDPLLLYEEKIAEIEELSLRIFPKRLGHSVSKAKTREIFNRLIGLFSTRQKGIGTDFHGLRDYIRGDPVKIIHWASSAKSSKLISKEFEEEKRLEVIIALSAGTTTRGNKFDFMLGVAMDIYDGIAQENLPVGLVIFDDDIITEYEPSPSHRRKMQIWAKIYGLLPRDIYADYSVLSRWIDKKSITGHLIIILGDLEYEFNQTVECVRQIRLRQNNCIFIDVWGYPFSYQEELTDAAADLASDNYGVILANVVGRGIEQDNIFKGVEMKTELNRHRAIYAYLHSPSDNVINSLERALFSFFGKKWKS